jgi:hypothetical protein
MKKYEATVKYLVNKEPKEGTFGPWHDVKLTIDTDEGEQEINVYADADQEDRVADLFDLSKGDAVDVVPKLVNNKWKWFLAHWMDDEGEPFSSNGDAAPPRAAPRRRAASPKQRVVKKQKEEAPPRKMEKRRQVASFPDEEETDKLLEVLEGHCSIVHRIWQGLDSEFSAETDEGEGLSIMPSEESLKSMALSIYISARDSGWL